MNKIIPLYKNKGLRTETKNYRPVALLSGMSKLLEMAVLIQITEHMENNKLWHHQQHAYRNGFSTITAMLTLQEEWMNGVNGKNQNLMISIDISAAFDLVNHDLLLRKMVTYGMDKNVIKWTSSYLSHRSQVVNI